jgi:hypothetical protein
MINEAPRQEDVWGSEGIAPPSFTSARDGRKWSASTPLPLYPRERAPDTHWVGGEIRSRPLQNLPHLCHKNKSVNYI